MTSLRCHQIRLTRDGHQKSCVKCIYQFLLENTPVSPIFDVSSKSRAHQENIFAQDLNG